MGEDQGEGKTPKSAAQDSDKKKKNGSRKVHVWSGTRCKSARISAGTLYLQRTSASWALEAPPELQQWFPTTPARLFQVSSVVEVIHHQCNCESKRVSPLSKGPNQHNDGAQSRLQSHAQGWHAKQRETGICASISQARQETVSFSSNSCSFISGGTAAPSARCTALKGISCINLWGVAPG